MSLAAYALTTVAKVQAVVGSIADARVELAINAVSKGMARYTGRTWEQANDIVEFVQGHGQELLILKRPLITAVSSVYIWDDSQTVTTLSSSVTPGMLNMETVYRTAEHDELGILQRFGKWPMGVGTWGDLTGQPNISPSVRPHNIRVIYSAGYTSSTVDPGLEQACIYEASHRLGGPARGLTGERTPGGWSQTWAPGASSGGEFSQLSEDVLDSFKREWF